MAFSTNDLLTLMRELAHDRAGDLTLERLAARAGWSPYHLQRVFARDAHESPKQYATRLRLERAALLLLARRDRSVVSIALESGFDSHDGFTRAFRRRFGATPRAYRERGLVSAPDDACAQLDRHSTTTAQVGPCIGVFRTRGARQRRDTMSHTITKTKVDETPFLFIRRRVETARIAEALGEILPRVYGHAMQSGIPLAGPPASRYAEWGPGLITLEAGLPVATATGATEDIELGTIGGGFAAKTVHVGPYDTLSEAHAAIERWLEDNGLSAGGAPWESYVTDPAEVPDPAEWKTEVYWPLPG